MHKFFLLKIAGRVRYTEDDKGVRCACHGHRYAHADEMVRDHK